MGKPLNPNSREAWGAIGNARKAGKPKGFAGNIRAAKGMGPNKACGHKGGIGRQGSKR